MVTRRKTEHNTSKQRESRPPHGTRECQDLNEQLPPPTPVSAGRAWAAVTAVLIVLVGGVFWMGTARVNSQTIIGGVVVAGAGPVPIQVSYPEYVLRLSATTGQQVKKGEELAVVADPKGTRKSVRSPVTGTISAVMTSPGTQLAPGEAVAFVDPIGAPLGAWLFCVPAQCSQLHPGQRADILTLKGTHPGRIVDVAMYPTSAEEVSARLGTRTAIPGLPSGGARLVRVDLPPSPRGWGVTLSPATGIITGSTRSPLGELLSGGW